jgi:hypothetical protein
MTPAAVDNWIVHPSRFELREDRPGNDLTYRPVVRPRQPTIEAFRARIHLPPKLLHLGHEDGTITFGGHDWWVRGRSCPRLPCRTCRSSVAAAIRLQAPRTLALVGRIDFGLPSSGHTLRDAERQALP